MPKRTTTSGAGRDSTPDDPLPKARRTAAATSRSRNRLAKLEAELAFASHQAELSAREAAAVRNRLLDVEASLRLRNREYDLLIRQNQTLAEEAQSKQTPAMTDRLEEHLTRVSALLDRITSQRRVPAAELTVSAPPQNVAPSPASVPRIGREPRSRFGRVRKWFGMSGSKLGASPRRERVEACGLFDAPWYLARNPDVEAAEIDPLEHYLATGSGEIRDPHPLFDTEYYMAQLATPPSPDQTPLEHYLDRGWQQGLSPHPLFDQAWYVSQYSKDIPPDFAPLSDFVTKGWRLGRSPHPLFDTRFYLEQLPDLAKASTDPLTHYLQNWSASGVRPGPHFDVSWYLQTYQDVAEAGVNPLLHFVTAGRAEGRLPRNGDGPASAAGAVGAPAGSPKRWAALPDVFSLRIRPPQARCVVISQVMTREEASANAAWLKTLRCDFDLIFLAAPHLVGELDEYSVAPHCKRVDTIESYDAAHDARLFVHLLNGRVLDPYTLIGWVSDARRIPRPLVPQNPERFFEENADCGALCPLTEPLAILTASSELRGRLAAAFGRLGNSLPEADTIVPAGGYVWLRSLLATHVRASRERPVDMAFDLAGPAPTRTLGGRDFVLGLVGGAAASGGFSIRESYE